VNDEMEEMFLHAAVAHFKNYWNYPGWTEKWRKSQPGQAFVSFLFEPRNFQLKEFF